MRKTKGFGFHVNASIFCYSIGECITVLKKSPRNSKALGTRVRVYIFLVLLLRRVNPTSTDKSELDHLNIEL